MCSMPELVLFRFGNMFQAAAKPPYKCILSRGALEVLRLIEIFQIRPSNHLAPSHPYHFHIFRILSTVSICCHVMLLSPSGNSVPSYLAAARMVVLRGT